MGLDADGKAFPNETHQAMIKGQLEATEEGILESSVIYITMVGDFRHVS